MPVLYFLTNGGVVGARSRGVGIQLWGKTQQLLGARWEMPQEGARRAKSLGWVFLVRLIRNPDHPPTAN